MDDSSNFARDLVHLTRLALSEKPADVRLFVARLVRRYRKEHPTIAAALETHLQSKSEHAPSALRRAGALEGSSLAVPESAELSLSLLRTWDPAATLLAPIVTSAVRDTLEQLIAERREGARLAAQGLAPASSAIFVGSPGVGKTLTARWIASQLGLPLLVLDLAAVISSYLGRSGVNIRAAFNHAKHVPSVLLLDEIDAIAKRRDDNADVGELKRLVTVIMQELDEWPSSGLLLAATNHGELIDRALWRRFDLVVQFSLPSDEELQEAIQRFAGRDRGIFARIAPALVPLFRGTTLSDVERAIQRSRRALALGRSAPGGVLSTLLPERPVDMTHGARIELAVALAETGAISHHRIAEATGVSRDTIRKHARRRTGTSR